MLEHGAPAIEAWMQHTLDMKNWWEPELVCDRWATDDAGRINISSVKNESGSSVRRAKVPISTPPCEGNRQQTVMMDNTGTFHNAWLGDAEESQSVNLSPIHLAPPKSP
ncbi:hypothetical protein ACKVWC_011363 [Pyricularia oryzae]